MQTWQAIQAYKLQSVQTGKDKLEPVQIKGGGDSLLIPFPAITQGLIFPNIYRYQGIFLIFTNF